MVDVVSVGNDETAVYDSVQQSQSGSEAARKRQRPAGRPATAVQRSASMGVTVVLLGVLLVASLVVLVAGLAMVEQEAPQYVPLTAITIGGGLLVWHIRAVLGGSGRRTAMISPWPWVGLVVIAAFGATLGFALFDLLTGVGNAARIALVSAGVVGMMAAVVGFVRDADIREQSRRSPAVPVAPEPEPEPEPEPVYFDPTGHSDQLHARGTGPLPKRGTASDASLWDEPVADETEPPRRARRGA